MKHDDLDVHSVPRASQNQVKAQVRSGIRYGPENIEETRTRPEVVDPYIPTQPGGDQTQRVRVPNPDEPYTSSRILGERPRGVV